MTVMKRVLAFLVTSAAVAATATQGQAATRFGVACLINETSATIRYQVKIGSASWETRTMSPGQSRWFSHRYDSLNQNTSPKLFVRYDSDARSGKNFRVENVLARKAATGQTCSEGAQYVFKHERANRDFILLVRRR